MEINEKAKKRIFKLLDDMATSHVTFDIEGITVKITKEWYEKNLLFFNSMFRQMQDLKDNNGKKET